MALEDTYIIKEKKFEVPKRELSIIVSKEGFYPSQLSAYVGEKVRFFMTASTDDPSCFFIEEKGVFLGAQKGKITEAEAYFDRPGIYNFYCPTGKLSGRLTILERKEDKKRRDIASELNNKKNKVKIWRPRDE